MNKRSFIALQWIPQIQFVKCDEAERRKVSKEFKIDLNFSVLACSFLDSLAENKKETLFIKCSYKSKMMIAAIDRKSFCCYHPFCCRTCFVHFKIFEAKRECLKYVYNIL